MSDPARQQPDAGHFSADFAEARRRFLAAARERKAELDGRAIGTRGARGEELAVDLAYLGPEAPERLLVVSSGIHGVEGFAGSALQLQLLAAPEALALPRDAGLLLVHGVNPYGFAALRRVNESNVDLNRNFLRHPEDHVANPAYDALHAAVNPAALDDESDAAARSALRAFAADHGFPKLQAALTSGQYAHPDGVYYGGAREERSAAILREVALRATRGARRVVWVDVHTGLGPYGEAEMITEFAPDDLRFRRARAAWGDAVKSTASGDSVSAAVCGSMDLAVAEALADRELTLGCAEFGTYDPIRVFWALRADNWLHAHGDPESPRGRAIKAELLEVFRPADPAWKRSVLAVGAGLVGRARAALAGD
ncbi:MAG TPA: DUF2817 domain-containing protein [Myxococcota bacterium]|nr:DUF2817 domain-containing protein [Myxococcota bacterium]